MPNDDALKPQAAADDITSKSAPLRWLSKFSHGYDVVKGLSLVTVLSDTSLQCNVPAGTSGVTVAVTVANVNGTGALPNGLRYHRRPTLTAVAPNTGPAGGGTQVTLTGSGFVVDAPGTNTVTFGGVAATSLVVVDDTSLTCFAPAGPPSTAVDVILSNANGAGTLPGGYTYGSGAPLRP